MLGIKLFYLIKSVQNNIGTPSTKFSKIKWKNIDINVFYLIESVLSNVGMLSIKFGIDG